MNQQTMPTWVLQNPEKNTRRLLREMEAIRAAYQYAEFYMDGNSLYLEAIICTRSWNQYVVRIYYPNDYPYSPPFPIAIDRDVIEYCSAPDRVGHNFHNYGVNTQYNGLMLCVINPNDNGTFGHSWSPDMTMKTVLERAILWFHAYEVKKANPSKPWILPE